MEAALTLGATLEPYQVRVRIRVMPTLRSVRVSASDEHAQEAALRVKPLEASTVCPGQAGMIACRRYPGRCSSLRGPKLHACFLPTPLAVLSAEFRMLGSEGRLFCDRAQLHDAAAAGGAQQPHRPR